MAVQKKSLPGISPQNAGANTRQNDGAQAYQGAMGGVAPPPEGANGVYNDYGDPYADPYGEDEYGPDMEGNGTGNGMGTAPPPRSKSRAYGNAYGSPGGAGNGMGTAPPPKGRSGAQRSSGPNRNNQRENKNRSRNGNQKRQYNRNRRNNYQKRQKDPNYNSNGSYNRAGGQPDLRDGSQQNRQVPQQQSKIPPRPRPQHMMPNGPMEYRPDFGAKDPRLEGAMPNRGGGAKFLDEYLEEEMYGVSKTERVVKTSIADFMNQQEQARYQRANADYNMALNEMRMWEQTYGMAQPTAHMPNM